jgi:hypothetical protein
VAAVSLALEGDSKAPRRNRRRAPSKQDKEMSRHRTGLDATSKADSGQIEGRSKPDTKIDGRTSAGRRFNALVRSLSADLGDDLTEAEMALVGIASATIVRAEQLQASIVNGDTIDDQELVRLVNSTTRVIKELHALKSKRGKSGPSALETYLAERADADDAEPVEP